MESGNVVEFIDRQKIMCAVILEVKKQRLRLLTETNREVNISAGRLSYAGGRLDMAIGRHKMVTALKELANRREALIDQVDIQELWEVLNTEQEWIDLDTMTDFCFPDDSNHDHSSAVVRAFFRDRKYFKFNSDRFFPYTEAQVEQIVARQKETDRRNRIIEEGGDWLKKVLKGDAPEVRGEALAGDKIEFVDILKSMHIFGKDSKRHTLGKAMLSRAGMDEINDAFEALVKLDVFSEDENVNLHRFATPISFKKAASQRADELVAGHADTLDAVLKDPRRRDLTGLSLMTIDGQSTRDFDDAISIEEMGDHYRVGVHIVDVGCFVQKGDVIDKEAFNRGSSIYMPDLKIPMLPVNLAEGLCSLRAGELRPGVSVLANVTPMAELMDFEIVPSVIRVERQLTYYDTNQMADDDREIRILRDLAGKFREMRLADGAVQITLPEINVWIDGDGEVVVNRINRESDSRMLVSELMIMGNWLMARFLTEHEVPAVFRSQPEPKERILKGIEGSVFQNIAQRRLLSRFILSRESDRHSGLGLDAYVTSTSPIRKYFDLITQRQIRSILGMEEPYAPEEIDHLIQMLEQPMSNVGRVQFQRNRYWLLKYLKRRIGEKTPGLVLYRKRNSHHVLLTEFMIECDLPISSGVDLKPEDSIEVTIQRVDPRKDVLNVFMS